MLWKYNTVDKKNPFINYTRSFCWRSWPKTETNSCVFVVLPQSINASLIPKCRYIRLHLHFAVCARVCVWKRAKWANAFNKRASDAVHGAEMARLLRSLAQNSWYSSISLSHILIHILFSFFPQKKSDLVQICCPEFSPKPLLLCISRLYMLKKKQARPWRGSAETHA